MQPGGAYVTRYNQLLKKLLSAKSGEPVEGLAPELLAVIVLENDRPEWAYESDQPLWIGKYAQPAVAAQFSGVGIRNPAGSGILVTVEGFAPDAAVNTGGELRERPNGTVGSTISAFYRDSRSIGNFGPGNLPVVLTQIANAAIQGNGPIWQISNAQTTLLGAFWIPFILHPGYEIIAWCDTVNTAFSCTFWGRFRAFEPSEL